MPDPKSDPPSGPDKSSRYLQFGDLDLDMGRREVRRDGKIIKLPRLSYRLLLALVERAPDVVTHDELVDRVWPGRVISPETITQRVKLLRNALGDDAQSPRYVGLVRGQGYRLLPEVRAREPAAGEAAAMRDWWRRPRVLATAGVVMAIAIAGLSVFVIQTQRIVPLEAPPNSVAVLPFAHPGGDQDNPHFSAGVADELRDRLSRIKGLKVSARASSVQFHSDAGDAREIARKLGVRWLIEGTVRQQNGHDSVSIQLIEGGSGFRALSRRFDLKTDNLLALQQDMVRAVVSEILAETDQTVSDSAPASGVVSAYELMLAARQIELKVRDEAPGIDSERLDRAIELYRQAIRLDPESALAHSRLAGALLYRGEVEAAEAPIRRALQIDPHLSEAQYTLGLYLWGRRDSMAGEAFRRAVEANPNNVDAIWELAKWEWHQQKVEKVGMAGDLFRRGIALDPLSLSRNAELGNYYGITGQREQALEVAQRIQNLFPNVSGYKVLGRVYEVTGDIDEAIAWVTRARAVEPDSREISWQLAELYARIGDEATARYYEPEPGVGQLFFTRRYGELIKLAEERLLEYPDDLKLYYLLAFAYSTVDRQKQAVYILQRAGLPRSALTKSRKADALEALTTMTGALARIGDQSAADRHAQWLVDHFQLTIDSGAAKAWWPNLYQACVLAVLGENEDALARLEKTIVAPGLLWYPVLRDAPCFRPLQDNERYQAVVTAIEERRATLRQKVPGTLARHGLRHPQETP